METSLLAGAVVASYCDTLMLRRDGHCLILILTRSFVFRDVTFFEEVFPFSQLPLPLSAKDAEYDGNQLVDYDTVSFDNDDEGGETEEFVADLMKEQGSETRVPGSLADVKQESVGQDILAEVGKEPRENSSAEATKALEVGDIVVPQTETAPQTEPRDVAVTKPVNAEAVVADSSVPEM